VLGAHDTFPETRVVVLLMTRFNIPCSIHSLFLRCVTNCLLFRTLEIVSACALFKVDAKYHKNFPYMHCVGTKYPKAIESQTRGYGTKVRVRDAKWVQ
jgi:hypothetical protein